MALLEARDIRHVFGSGSPRGAGGVVVVDGVSLSLEAGRTLGVVGESGSGKSTLGEIVGGLLRPTSGAVLYRGSEVGGLDRRRRRAYRRAVQFTLR